MKVVLFCGGLGTRIRDYSDTVPKPMVPIGYRPILWHVMRYYAHHGHKDFILCLGHKADVVKRYFRDYEEYLSNDFVLSNGGREIELLNRDIHDWRITFVDTGASSSIGERLRRVRSHLDGDEHFLANYADGLTDLDLNRYVTDAVAGGRIATFLGVRPPQTFHAVQMRDDGQVTRIEPIERSDIWINGGYFVFRNDVFDHIEPGEDLVAEPFERLIRLGELAAIPFSGFWTAMDTFKDRERLETLYAAGDAPWELWKNRDAQVASLPEPALPRLVGGHR
jgi:glucose-1-phosphate cytidylyltransferase